MLEGEGLVIEELILKQGILKTEVEDAASLSTGDPIKFALIRRQGLGTSDSSQYLGVNPYSNIDDLIANKLSLIVTEEEKAIGLKENVRKGNDLEPVILEKSQERLQAAVFKPKAMYRFINEPQLTVNFDGITYINETLIPVEAKFCSKYATKHYDRSKALAPGQLIKNITPVPVIPDLARYITEAAREAGIPPYYYTQLQQEMMALDSDFGYLSVQFDDGWQHHMFFVKKDSIVQHELLTRSRQLWQTITALRQRGGV